MILAPRYRNYGLDLIRKEEEEKEKDKEKARTDALRSLAGAIDTLTKKKKP